MAQTSDSPVSLEGLLRLKRLEKPDDAFWKRFDQRLEQRRLQALFASHPPERRGLSAWVPRLGWAAATAATLVLGFMALDTTRGRALFAPESAGHEATVALELNAAALPAASTPSTRMASTAVVPSRPLAAGLRGAAAESRFVVDVLSDRSEELPFQRVMANPVLSNQRAAETQFVFDRLPARSGSAAVTLLVDRSYGQF